MIHTPEGQYILHRLKTELPEHFYYHNVDHTLDVYHAAASISEKEHISEEDKKLLLVAALYHDSGYLNHVKDHEKASCDIAREALPNFGYTNEQTNHVCAIIMATQLPQQPKNKLEEIICDADLDYLGRADFIDTGDKLYREMKALGNITDKKAWDELQISFLTQHRYFTKTAVENKEPKKQENLRALQNKHLLPK